MLRSKVDAWRGMGTGCVVAILAFAAGCSGELGDPAAMDDQLGTAQSSPMNGGVGLPAGPITSANPTPGTSGSEVTPGMPGNGSPEEPNQSEGAVGPTDVDAPVAPQGVPFTPLPGALRRLTATQFRNAVFDVFGVVINTSELDADSWNGDFAVIGASTVVTSERGVEQYHAAIENAVDAVFANAERQRELTGCESGFTSDDPCVRDFLERLGRRAWRRPLDTSEVDRLSNLARDVATDFQDSSEGLRWATVALFTSPNFLYRVELGSADASGGWSLGGYEMATRLAFLLWNSAPDEVLLDDAERGALNDAQGVRRASQRLLDAPQGRESVGAFAEEYMQLHRVGTQAKDTALFPEYGPALQDAMVRDMRETWETVAFDDQASALELFTTPRVTVNAELAELYGLDVRGLDSQTFQEVTLPADSPRVGILGKAAFLSQFANQKEGSPTLRGKFIRQVLMCTPIPPPPGDADIVLDEPPADMPLTKRQRLELHRTSPACAGCHALMDPLGLPFESFDAIGRYRTTERGLTIDPSGEVDGQVVANSREFGAALASSETIVECLVRKYYSYAMGHEVRDADLGVVDTLAGQFEASGYNLRELIMGVVTHDAFSSVAPRAELETVP